MAGAARAAFARIDSTTLAASYDAYGPAVYGLAVRVTGDGEVAARITAEVFATLRFVSTRDGIDGLRACVLTDAHRRAVAWTRENPAQQHSTALPLEAFANLPDDEHAVIMEGYFGGKTYDEVAATLDKDRGEVARLMQSALHRLGVATPLSPRLLPAQQAI